MAAPRIFVSMGTPYAEQYTRFREELDVFLREQCGADARIIGKNEYPVGSPLSKIRDVMRTCHGVIIVAYERKHVAKGTDRRGSTEATSFVDRTYPTPWNHIESAMAYSLDLPIHILCQRGLTEEGLIETKMDWYVQYLDIAPGSLNDSAIGGTIRSWVRERVVPRASRPSIGRSVSGHSKLSDMSPVEIWSFFGIVAAAFGAGVGAAVLFPNLFGG
jgi:hypothetical protein